MHLESYQPSKHENFWCSKCDHHTVDSLNPESGAFFIQFGHAYNQRAKRFDGNYVGVMFALCNVCLKHESPFVPH